MNKLMTLAFLAASAMQAEEPELTLRIVAGNVSGPMLSLAKKETSTILRQADVRVRWTEHATAPLRTCSGRAVDISSIDILIQDQTRPQDHPGALGYSRPFASSGFRVVIFYDRILSWMPAPSPQLLGHVIAHELGHMLMGTLSHAETGVMEAHWTRHEMQQLQMHPLTFTPGDTGMIARRILQQGASCPAKELLASDAMTSFAE